MNKDPFEEFRKKLRSEKNNIQDNKLDESSNKNIFEFIDEDNVLDNFEPPKMNTVFENIQKDEEKNTSHPPIEEKQNENKLEFVFFPRNDITTYDLARILAFTQLMISRDIYDKFPSDLQKFFVKFDEIQKPINQ